MDNFYNSSNINSNISTYAESIPKINNILTLLSQLFFGFYSSVFGNINFTSSNILIIFQSFENIFIIFLLIYIFANNYSVNKKELFFWIAYLFLSLGILGMVIENFGTLSRFKYSFIVLFIIAVNNLKKEIKN
tara:strand:- start:921 stop:1319 length:399 start_codon:yes stop_codon:yes gene_type:complete